MLEKLVFEICALEENIINKEKIILIKKKFAKDNKLKNIPSNVQVIKTYYDLIKKNNIKKNPLFEKFMVKREVRSMSWIVPVQVLTKPYFCPWKCIFCPNDASMPKSYINTEPGAMRALLNDFDPIKQVYNRLLSLRLTWHNIDKIEMIVLWWTFDAYLLNYQESFIKWLYDATNSFSIFFEQVDFEQNETKSHKITISKLDEKFYSKNLQEAIKLNETANQRIIWLTIETRPEFVNDKMCIKRREFWITRVEIWVQNLFDDVLQKNERWNNVLQIKNAINLLRKYWFKICTHIMPGLYWSSIEKDIETMKILYSDIFLKPDEIKFYPTSVIPNTKLFDFYKSWEFKPISNEDIMFIIEEMKLNIIPPYTRIKRLIRDIPATEIVSWANITNLRQIVVDNIKMKIWENQNLRKNFYWRLVWINDKENNIFFCENIESLIKSIYLYTENVNETYIIWWQYDTNSLRNFVCLCTRCREMKNISINEKNQKQNNENVLIVVRRYQTSCWIENFISIEDKYWYLYWFIRLLLPNINNYVEIDWLWKNCWLIRELHVYWKMKRISEVWLNSQHIWFWTKLLNISEQICKKLWFYKLSVISWVWVRQYYQKLWFNLEWTYMVRYL